MEITFTGKSIKNGERIVGFGFKTENSKSYILYNNIWEEIIEETLRINYPNRMEQYPNANISNEEIDELHERLVKTSLNYCIENQFGHIDAIYFSIDGLQDSVEQGMWSPCTDSSLKLVGYHDNKRKIIAEKI